MVLVTETERHVGPLQCEVCDATRPQGRAFGVVVQEEHGSETPWLLWVLNDGWSVTDESAGSIAVCPDHQQVKVLSRLRFTS